jgi:hypothetical protein
VFVSVSFDVSLYYSGRFFELNDVGIPELQGMRGPILKAHEMDFLFVPDMAVVSAN